MADEHGKKKNGFFIPVTKTEMIKGLGQVDVAWITMGDESGAEEFIANLEPKDQPHAFANFILSKVVRKPELSFEQVEALTDEQVRAIASIAGSIGDESEYFDADIDDARQALFESIRARREASLAKMADIITKVAQPYTVAFDVLRQVNQHTNWMQSLVDSSVMRAMNESLSHYNAAQDLFKSPLEQINQSPQFSAASSIMNLSVTSDWIRQISGISSTTEVMLANISRLGSQMQISETYIDSKPWITSASAAFMALGNLPQNLVGLSNSALLGASTSWATELSMGSALFDAIEPSPPLADMLTHRGLASAGFFPNHLHTPKYQEPKPVYIDDEATLEQATHQEESQRRQRCQDILHEFERAMRKMIETKLSKIEGNKWWKRRVPEPTRRAAENLKQRREVGNAAVHHPIHYTNLGELIPIINRADNWSEAFEEHFKNRQHLETMFHFVSTVRNDVDHGRHPDNDSYFRFAIGINYIYEMLGMPVKIVMAEVYE